MSPERVDGPGLLVAERFGVERPTFQGEGPSSGVPALFIRLSRCNLTCTWCDTPYTWDTSRFDVVDEPPGQVPGQVLRGRLEGEDVVQVVVVELGVQIRLERREVTEVGDEPGPGQGRGGEDDLDLVAVSVLA